MQAFHAASASSGPPPAQTADAQRHLVDHLERSTLFQEYRRAFECATRLPLVLRAVGTFQIPLLSSRRANPFCRLMAERNDTCSHCLQLQQHAEETAVADPVILKCHAGLTEAAVPVRVGEHVIAHLLTGQIHLRRPDKTVFEEFRRTLGLGYSKAETARLRAAYFASRQLTRKQFESLVRLLGVFAQHLGAISSQVLVQENAAESPVVAKARAFIHERFASQISVNDAARNVHMSTFHFCKVFKSGTGLTFTEYLARLRVEYVKQHMLNPHVRVSEAAFAAGFQSLSQFNRVFRRIAGESPRDYRARIIAHPPATNPAHAAA